MTATILIDRTEHGQAAALWVDGQLEDLFMDADGGPPAPGAIFAALVSRPIKGLGGALLDLGGGQAGFLRDAKGLSPGQRVLVQVGTYAEPGKSVPVTRRLLFKSRYAIVTPAAPGLNIARSIKDDALRDALDVLAREEMDGTAYGAILRSACADADADAIRDDLRAIRAAADAVLADRGTGAEMLLDGAGAEESAWRDWPVDAEVIAEDGAFERFDIWSAIAGLRTARAELGGGAWMSVEATRALVAVDVNTGGDFSPAACLKANRAAAQVLARQLRLRGLGGQVVVDFAPMGKKDRREIETLLRRAFRSDPVETALLGWSNLGLYEAQRKRERRPLEEVA